MTSRKAQDLKREGLLRRLEAFTAGQNDRKAGQPAARTNGDYLDGWYSPDTLCPGFLSPAHFAELRPLLVW